MFLFFGMRLLHPMKNRLIFVFTFTVGLVFSQNVEIRGKAAPVYAGKIIHLQVFQDFITNQRLNETSDTIDASGYFELTMHAGQTQPVILKIDNITAQLFVEPDFVYGITFPEIDSSMNRNRDVELPVNLGLMVNDSLELNNLIFDFEELYNRYFIPKDGQYLGRVAMFRRCDSLQVVSLRKYRDIKQTYFKNYVQYRIASANASLSRGEKFLLQNYITGRPIQYHHAGYMQFFNAFFKGYLARQSSQRQGESLYYIINTKADYPALLNFMRYDKELRSDSLRELILLRELWDYHFNSEFDPEAVKTLIVQLNRSTQITEHKVISQIMLAYMNKLKVGSQAPSFAALSKDNKLMQFSSLKKHWVYLNFFSTGNIESLKEMPKIATLKKKMGDKVIFVSICLDDSVTNYRKFLRENPKYDWPIWYNNYPGIKVTAKDAYSVTGTEAYFLIDQLGNLVASPAISPSKGIEYKLNIIFRIKRKDTKTGLR